MKQQIIYLDYTPLFKMKSKYFSIKSGDLRLQVNRKEDIFHAQEVNFLEVLPDYEKLIGINSVGFKNGLFHTIGTRLDDQPVELTAKDTIISGFYADQLFKEIKTPYQINIYITYETE